MIPAFLLSFAGSFGIPAKFQKAAVVGTAIILLVIMLGLGKCAYDRSVIRNHETKAALRQEKAERKADANLQVSRAADDAAAQQRKQEMDNATRNIPDQAPSARQRAIACAELVRDAKAHHRPSPAC